MEEEKEKKNVLIEPFLKVLYDVWKQASTLIDVHCVWIMTYSNEYIINYRSLNKKIVT